jgi:hypothetical protein
MIRLAQALAAAIAVVGAGLLTGCSNSASGLTGGAAEIGGVMKNEDPMARPVGVAWTSARAKRCGFYFDGPKLRTAYLAWERGQGTSPEELAKIETAYDTTFKRTFDRVAADAGYCSDRKGGEIKADLQRYLAGDYTPNLPKPKQIASCNGFFGCQTQSEEPFSTKNFWAKQDRDNPKDH